MQLDYRINEGVLNIAIDGDIIRYEDEKKIQALFSELSKANSITVEAKRLGKWDSSLVVILFELQKYANANKLKLSFVDTPKGLQSLLNLAFAVNRKPSAKNSDNDGIIESLGAWGIAIYDGFNKGLSFLSSALSSLFRFFFGRASMRWVDFFFALQDCGYRALPIVSLISFMVGLILAFVGAVQLETFGAQIYVASLVTIGMTRIMGAIMTGIIMAGRTGASYAATIGTMQVNEEIDALRTMGVQPIDFLVLPRMTALIITMPLLTMWSDFMGMLGGGAVGVLMLDIPMQKYLELSIEAISMNNFLVGIFHGLVFGIVTAVCGCYYGINCGRDANSVGVATTKSVVSAIVWMIVMTGVITISCEVLGV